MNKLPDMLAPLLYGDEVVRVFAPERQLALMVQFEVSLAFALEGAGLAPVGTGNACKRGAVAFASMEHAEAIAQAAVQSGNVAVPFVKLLTAHVRSLAGSPADFIHFGATSQDLLDTVLVLQLRTVMEFIASRLKHLTSLLVSLIADHRHTVLAGRTWLQQGPPVTLALKAAQWLSALQRHGDRLQAVRERACVLQFGGAVGTLASLGDHGAEVTNLLAERLGIPEADVPWHSERDSLVEVASVLAMIDGTLGKMARDLSLMAQNEVAEISIEAGESAGGSSTMPHKRNPVSLAVVLSAAVRAPGLASTMMSAMLQEHERGLGGWHAEWSTLPELCRLTCGALDHMVLTFQQLRVDREAMSHNLHLLHGVTMAESIAMELARYIGRPAAHQRLEAAARDALLRKVDLLTVLREKPHIQAHMSVDDLESAAQPENYLGSASRFIDQVLARARTDAEPPQEATDALR